MVNFWYFKLEECKGFEILNCAKWTVLKEADIPPIIWSYFSLDTGVEIHQSSGTICIAAFNNPDKFVYFWQDSNKKWIAGQK